MVSHLCLHFLRWLYTSVEHTETPQCSNRAFATAVRWTSLNPLSVLTPVLIKPHIFSNTKLDMNGSHFMVAVPFCPVFKALSASLRFLFFFVVANLAATSAAT